VKQSARIAAVTERKVRIRTPDAGAREYAAIIVQVSSPGRVVRRLGMQGLFPLVIWPILNTLIALLARIGARWVLSLGRCCSTGPPAHLGSCAMGCWRDTQIVYADVRPLWCVRIGAKGGVAGWSAVRVGLAAAPPVRHAASCEVRAEPIRPRGRPTYCSR